jgi:anti-anti-sigma regulatory factor
MLMVTTPADPDDLMVKTRQEEVLRAMERYRPKGLVLDISGVETLDSLLPGRWPKPAGWWA